MMKPSVFSPQMPDSAYTSTGITTAAAQTPFFPGSAMDPGRVSAGLPGQTISPAAPSALSKGPLKKYGTVQPAPDLPAPYSDVSAQNQQQFTSHPGMYVLPTHLLEYPACTHLSSLLKEPGMILPL